MHDVSCIFRVNKKVKFCQIIRLLDNTEHCKNLTKKLSATKDNDKSRYNNWCAFI